MTRPRLILLALLLLVSGILIAQFVRTSAPPADSSLEAAPPIVRGEPAPAQPPPVVRERPPAGEPAHTAKPTVARGDLDFARYDSSDDLLAFIESIHEAAKAGDATAMYYMYLALKRCSFEYPAFFTRRGRELTLDEALVKDAGGFMPEVYYRKLHRQCQRMRAANLKPFGEADAWMSNAIEAGSPLAQIWKARDLAANNMVNRNAESEAEARRLALLALRSREPMVLLQAGEVAAALRAPAEPNMVELTAWTLAACQSGLDCSTKVIWFQLLCKADSNCQPYESGVDLLRRQLGNDFDAAERRAREINAALDEDRFDNLGF